MKRARPIISILLIFSFFYVVVSISRADEAVLLEIGSFQKRIASYEKDIQEKDKTILWLIEQNELLKNTIQLSEKEMSSLLDQIQSIPQKIINVQNPLQERIEELEGKLAQLHESGKANNAETAKLSAQAKDYAKEKIRLEDEMTSLKEKLIVEQAAVNSKEGELASEQSKTSELTVKLKQVEKDLSLARSANETLTEKSAAMNKEALIKITSLQGQLKEQEKFLNEKVSVLNEKANEINLQIKSIDKLNAQIVTLTQEKADLTNELVQINAQIGNIEDVVEKRIDVATVPLEQQLKLVTLQLEQAKLAVKQREFALNDLKQENTMLMRELESLVDHSL